MPTNLRPPDPTSPTKPSNPYLRYLTRPRSFLTPVAVIASLSTIYTIYATAQEWTPYRVSRFNFIFDIPPDFNLVKGELQEHAEGGLFKNDDPMHPSTLSVWGMDIPHRDFAAAVEDQKQKDIAAGWDITYEVIKPNWAVYSGIRHAYPDGPNTDPDEPSDDDQIRYMKAITVCNDRAAFFLIDYDRDLKVEYDPIITRMEKSMRKEGC